VIPSDPQGKRSNANLCGVFFIFSYAVGLSVIHPELLHRNEEGNEVEKSGDPAIERVLQ
jgi:hypothetical protein